MGASRRTLVKLFHRFWPETSRINHELIVSEIDMRDVDAVFWAPDLQSMLREPYIQLCNLLG